MTPARGLRRATLLALVLLVTVPIPLAARGAPGARVAAAPLKGLVQLNVGGRRIHGYRTILNAQLGATTGSELQLSLVKQTGVLEQTHAWSVNLLAGDVELDRAKGTIAIHHRLGSRGVVDVRFTPTRHRHTTTCQSRHQVLDGRLTGTVRLAVGDRFFKTIVLRRMTGFAQDNGSAPGCRPPCPRRHDFVQGSLPYVANRPNLSFGAAARARRLDPPHVYVSVFEPTAGSPFTVISHVLYAKGPKRLFSSNAALTRAQARAPGGALSGQLAFASAGRLHKIGSEPCKGGPSAIATRPAKVTGGRIVAAFDSIGTYRVDTNLNGTYPHTHIRRTTLARQY